MIKGIGVSYPFEVKRLKGLAEVKRYALYGGGIYRMNTDSAQFYGFTPHATEGWNGGWDWSSTLCYGFDNNRPANQYAIELATGKCYQLAP